MTTSVKRHVFVKMVLHVIRFLVLVIAQLVGRESSVSRVVLMVGMAQHATVAVIVYINLPVIMSLDSAHAVQDGKGLGATNLVTMDCMVLLVSLFVSVMRTIQCHVTL